MFRSKLGLDSYIVIAKVAVMNGILVNHGFNQYAFRKLYRLTVLVLSSRNSYT